MRAIWYGATVLLALAATSSLADSELVIALEGQPNFRDLGGYETSDGRTVRSGMIYRSGELPRLTDADIEILEELGVRTVVNFLTPGEIEFRGPDRLPDGVREVSLPITGEVGGIPDAPNKLVEARKDGDFRRFPPEFNPMVHEELAGGMADAQFAALFEVLADEGNYPVVFHCSHGIHRTGTAAALVLSALGVPWETAREDYLLSNDARAAEVTPRIEELEALASGIEMTAEEREANSRAIRAFYLLEGEYIDASRAEAERRFEGIDGYLQDGLDQSQSDLSRLRALMLE